MKVCCVVVSRWWLRNCIQFKSNWHVRWLNNRLIDWLRTVKFADAGEGSDGDFVKDGVVGLRVAGDGLTEVPEGNLIVNDGSSLRTRCGDNRSAWGGRCGTQDVLVASVGIRRVVVSRSACGGLNDGWQIFGRWSWCSGRNYDGLNWWLWRITANSSSATSLALQI